MIHTGTIQAILFLSNLPNLSVRHSNSRQCIVLVETPDTPEAKYTKEELKEAIKKEKAELKAAKVAAKKKAKTDKKEKAQARKKAMEDAKQRAKELKKS